MTNLILSIAEWLTSQHSLTLSGWAWLLLIPAAGALLILAGWLGFYVTLAGMLRGMRW